MADADIGGIASAAGVARGTFYFHFPTKEHVLAELTRREEALMAEELADALASTVDLKSALAEVIRRVVAEEARLGHVLFRDVLNLYFSATQPELKTLPHTPSWPSSSNRSKCARPRRGLCGGRSGIQRRFLPHRALRAASHQPRPCTRDAPWPSRNTSPASAAGWRCGEAAQFVTTHKEVSS